MKEKKTINESRNHFKTVNFNLHVRIPLDKELHDKSSITFLHFFNISLYAQTESFLTPHLSRKSWYCFKNYAER